MFYSSVKTSSLKNGLANESVALTEYVTFLISQSVTVNLFQPGRILSKSHPFLRASLDSIVTNVDNLETRGVENKCPSSKLDQSINDFLKDKKFYLEKANGKIQLKRSHKYFYQIQGQMFCTKLKRVNFVVYFGKNVPLYVETVTFNESLARNFTTN